MDEILAKKKRELEQREITEQKKSKSIAEIKARPGSAQPQPFYVMIGRDNGEARLEKLRKKRLDNPPPGQYNPKFADRHIFVPQYFKPANEGRPSSALTQGTTGSSKGALTEEDLNFNPDKLKSKVQGYVNMGQKTDRLPLNHRAEVFDEEGKQFLYSELPRTSSKYRPISSFSMKKAASRKGFYDEKEDLPDYAPNYEFVQRRVGSAVPKFELVTGRKPFGKHSATANENLYDFDHYAKEKNSHVYRRNFYTDLSKKLPKELDPDCGLPSFMQTKRPATAKAK